MDRTGSVPGAWLLDLSLLGASKRSCGALAPLGEVCLASLGALQLGPQNVLTHLGPENRGSGFEGSTRCQNFTGKATLLFLMGNRHDVVRRPVNSGSNKAAGHAAGFQSMDRTVFWPNTPAAALKSLADTHFFFAWGFRKLLLDVLQAVAPGCQVILEKFVLSGFSTLNLSSLAAPQNPKPKALNSKHSSQTLNPKPLTPKSLSPKPLNPKP